MYTAEENKVKQGEWDVGMSVNHDKRYNETTIVWGD